MFNRFTGKFMEAVTSAKALVPEQPSLLCKPSSDLEQVA